jgi:hypothetical protein
MVVHSGPRRALVMRDRVTISSSRIHWSPGKREQARSPRPASRRRPICRTARRQGQASRRQRRQGRFRLESDGSRHLLAVAPSRLQVSPCGAASGLRPCPFGSSPPLWLVVTAGLLAHGVFRHPAFPDVSSGARLPRTDACHSTVAGSAAIGLPGFPAPSHSLSRPVSGNHDVCQLGPAPSSSQSRLRLHRKTLRQSALPPVNCLRYDLEG